MAHPIDRRVFLETTATSALAAAAAPAGTAAKETPMKTYHEAARDVPVAEEADVLVAGAGPAGVAAALAAARQGAKTRLIEVHGCLGGVWTAGLLSWILDAGNKTGLMTELTRRMKQRHMSVRYGGSIGYDCEQMKLLLEDMCTSAGVAVRLHTRVVAASVTKGKLSLAITESKSGRQAWRAKAFVDATGDGDLSAWAGCEFAYGREGGKQAQPMSMICMLGGIAPEGVARFVRGLAEPKGVKSPKAELLREMKRAGVTPSYTQPTMFYLRPGLFCLMANHEYDVCGFHADDLTAATLRGRAEVHKLVNALRKLGGPWKDVQILATAEHIGVREGRRIRGLYEITADDLATGKKHDDAVCQCRFPVDVHSTDPGKDKGITRERVRAKPYDIPYRSLVAKDVDALLLAGRCISGDFLAHSSYRVTGDSVPLGEAAGTAAALAANTSRSPKNLPWPEIKKAMDAATQSE